MGQKGERWGRAAPSWGKKGRTKAGCGGTPIMRPFRAQRPFSARLGGTVAALRGAALRGGGVAMCCDAVIVAAAAIGGRVFGEEAG